jgi:hypothetical protein
MNRLTMAALSLSVVAGFAAGCGGGSSPAAAPSTTAPALTSAPTSTLGPVAPSTVSTPAVQPSQSTGSSTTIPAEEVADPLLPSKVGAGALPKKTVIKLAQFFEDKVSAAYADGKPNELYHYLAGPMLTGNRGTISLLNSQNKRNVYKIKVRSATLQTNQAHHIVFTMTGDMTVDYFYNSKTRKIIDNGLPGPSQVKFVMFFDQNPKTKTWYWTGEENNADGTGNGVTQGSNGTVEDGQ